MLSFLASLLLLLLIAVDQRDPGSRAFRAMAAAAADTSDWDDGDDDAAGTATTEPLPGSRRRTRRRSLRIALPPHLDQELHQSLMSEEQAVGAAGTVFVEESDGGASSGATQQQSDTERIVELNSSLHDAVAVTTLSSSSFAFEDEEEEEIPLAELLPRVSSFSNPFFFSVPVFLLFLSGFHIALFIKL